MTDSQQVEWKAVYDTYGDEIWFGGEEGPAVKQPWEMTREEILGGIEKAGFEYRDQLGSTWRTTGEIERVGLTYRRMIENIETGEIKQSTLAEYMDDHVAQVQQAVSEGKPVPREVLEEYAGEKWADEALAKLPEAEAPAESEVDNG